MSRCQPDHMTSKGFFVIGPNVCGRQSDGRFQKSPGQADALIGGAKFAYSYKRAEATQDSLLEVVET